MPVTIRVAPGTPVSTLEQAIALLPPGEEPAVIHLCAGVYRGQAVLSRPHTTLEGEGADRTRLVHDAFARDTLPGGERRGTFRTATLRTDAPHITLRGLTIENDARPRERAGQAIALYADGDHLLAEDCVLRGAQDTLFTAPLPPREIEPNGFAGPKQHAPRTPQRQTYRRCRIEGDIDFIFGSAAAWFEQCDIVAIDGRGDPSTPFAAYCTAASTPEGQAFGYVFHRCRFLNGGCAPGSVYLGRPWREWAQTVLLHCTLDDHIAPAGFDDWGKPLAHRTAFYAEYGCTGPGAASPRAPFVRRLTREQAEAMTYEAFAASMPG